MVVGGIAFADQPRDGAHASAQQVHDKVVLGRIAAVDIAGDGEVRVGLQCDQPAIGKTDLCMTGGAGQDHVAGVQLGTFGQRGAGISPPHTDFSGGKLDQARNGKRLQRPRRQESDQQAEA